MANIPMSNCKYLLEITGLNQRHYIYENTWYFRAIHSILKVMQLLLIKLQKYSIFYISKINWFSDHFICTISEIILIPNVMFLIKIYESSKLKYF